KNLFLKALEQNGLDPLKAIIIEGDLRIEGGRKAFEQLYKLTPMPTAVVAANDLMALGVLWAARGAGLELPKDLSVIGLDDIDLASKVSPSLSTIALPRREIGRLAMQTLLEMIQAGKEAVKSRLTVDTTFVLRQSTERIR
ncbi:MAG: substrate-binding domain-containing protein, partial [Desulfitobacteriaceae bacterium]|nr:substrate-binding domain-containing protein [Desulfitobacteriaceae bacterium]